ncbi:MAG: hypothetical protein JO080_11370 [Mucilaginibacter sp.]|nr:hypothetical protein [Mucilaginibacter sp.]
MDAFQSIDKAKDVKLPIMDNCTMTLCLGNNNKVLYYMGDIKKPSVGPIVTGCGKDSLPKAISENALKFKNDTSYMIVLIKASNKATYKNFVKALRIIDSCKVKSYAVVEITPQEIDLLKKQNVY